MSEVVVNPAIEKYMDSLLPERDPVLVIAAVP